jgi:hypothetical protein
LAENRTGRRFPLALPIEIENSDSDLKESGTTRDLSASGIYISAPSNFQVGSRVKFEINVPGELVGAKQDVAIECRGRVVRVDHPPGSEESSEGVACVIDSYEFVRKD